MNNFPPPMPKLDLPVPKEELWLEENLYLYDNLMTADLPEPQWLIPHMIPKPGLVAITGPSGHFKTFFVTWLATRIGAKNPQPLFEGWDYPETLKMPARVVFLEEEMSDVQMKNRCLEMFSEPQEDFRWYFSSGFNLQNERMVEELRAMIIKDKIDLLVFDPFTSVSAMKDENSNAEARLVMDTMRHKFVDDPEVRCSVIFIHHPPKGANDIIRGAGDIKGKADMHFTIVKKLKEGGNKQAPTFNDYEKDIITVTCEKTRYETALSFQCQLVNDADSFKKKWIYLGSRASIYEKTINEIKEKILDKMTSWTHENPPNQTSVAEAIGSDRRNGDFKKAWRDLIEKEEIEGSPQKGYTVS